MFVLLSQKLSCAAIVSYRRSVRLHMAMESDQYVATLEARLPISRSL